MQGVAGQGRALSRLHFLKMGEGGLSGFHLYAFKRCNAISCKISKNLLSVLVFRKGVCVCVGGGGGGGCGIQQP